MGFGAANFVDNTNTATKKFKRVIFFFDMIKSSKQPRTSNRLEEIAKKKYLLER